MLATCAGWRQRRRHSTLTLYLSRASVHLQVRVDNVFDREPQLVKLLGEVQRASQRVEQLSLCSLSKWSPACAAGVARIIGQPLSCVRVLDLR